MSKQLSLLIGALILFPLLCTGCSSSSPAAPEAKALPIPQNSPLAKVKPDMGVKQVTDLLGEPNDRDTYMTGKQFSPFYYGGDTHRMKFYYKGMGRITFTRSSAFSGDMRVMDDGIEYDPNESGYK